MKTENTFNIVTMVRVLDPQGNEVPNSKGPDMIGERSTWGNQIVRLGVVMGGMYTLEVRVAWSEMEKYGHDRIVYSKVWSQSEPGKEFWKAVPNRRFPRTQVFRQQFAVNFQDRNVAKDQANICVVDVDPRGEFFCHQFAVVEAGGFFFLSYQITWHGAIFRKKSGGVYIPDLCRKNISNETLLWKIVELFENQPEKKEMLPEFGGNYRCWLERINYPRLDEIKDGRRVPLVIGAMADPLGLMFARDHKGRHITFRTKDVGSFTLAPFGTVGTICLADKVVESKGRLFAQGVEFLDDPESLRIYTDLTSGDFKPIHLEDLYPEKKFGDEWKPEPFQHRVSREMQGADAPKKGKPSKFLKDKCPKDEDPEADEFLKGLFYKAGF